MRARGFFCLAATLVGAGCGDPGSVCSQPAMLAAMPVADVENLSRVCGVPRRNVVPTVAESGDVWPPAPAHVPTSLELLHEKAIAGPAEAGAPVIRHARGYGLCRAVSRAPGAPAAAAPGVALGLCFAPSVHGPAERRDGPA